jgi:hypothetical protein
VVPKNIDPSPETRSTPPDTRTCLKAPDLNTVSHTILPKPQAQRSDRKNKTWDPELRMETLDPDRNWIACFIHDTGFEAAQDRHNSPADPPHTKA